LAGFKIGSECTCFDQQPTSRRSLVFGGECLVAHVVFALHHSNVSGNPIYDKAVEFSSNYNAYLLLDFETEVSIMTELIRIRKGIVLFVLQETTQLKLSP
jgi:hypothetical protein